MGMSWAFLPILVCVTAIFTDEVFSQDYRLPPYPAVEISTWDCIEVPDELSLGNDIPLALLQYVNATSPLDFPKKMLEDNMAREFAKLYAIKQSYEPFLELLFWLDNIHVSVETILEPGNETFVYFNNTRFANLFMKSAFHGIVKFLSNSTVGSLNELESFLEQLPLVVYASIANEKVDLSTLQNQQLKDVHYEKILKIVTLISNNSDAVNLTEEFIFTVREMNDKLKGLFDMIASRSLTTSLTVNSESESVNVCLDGSTGTELPGEDITSSLTEMTELVEENARSILTFVEDKLKDKVILSIRNIRCSTVECWVRNPFTSIAWPALRLSETDTGQSFFLYFAEGTDNKKPNLPLLTPDWVKTYILENEPVRSVLELENEIYILSVVYRYFEAAYSFLAWCTQVKAYVADILTIGVLEPPQKFTKETSYQAFMELGLYLLERNNTSLRFSLDNISNMMSELFKVQFDLIDWKEQKRNANIFENDRSYYNNMLDEIIKALLVGSHDGDPDSFDLEDHIINKTSLLEIVMYLEDSPMKMVSQQTSEDDVSFSPIKQIKRQVTPFLPNTPNPVDQITELIRRLEDLYNKLSDIWSIQIQEERKSQGHSYVCDKCKDLSYVPSVGEQQCIESWVVGPNQEPVLREFVIPSVSQNYTSLINEQLSSNHQFNKRYEKDKRLLKMSAFQIMFEQMLKYSFLIYNAKMKLADMDELESNSLEYILRTFQEQYRLVGYQASLVLSDNIYNEFLQYVGSSMIHSEFQVDQEEIKLDDMELNLTLKYQLPLIDLYTETQSVHIRKILIDAAENLTYSDILDLTVEYDDTFDSQSGIVMSYVCPNVSVENSTLNTIRNIDKIVRNFNNELLILAKEFEEYVLNISNSLSNVNRFSNSTGGGTTTERDDKTGASSTDNEGTTGATTGVPQDTEPITDDSATDKDTDGKDGNGGSRVTENSSPDGQDGGGVTERSDGNDDATEDDTNEPRVTETADVVEEETEGGQNNQNNPTDGTPVEEQPREYRASMMSTQDIMALVLEGDEDRKYVQLDFVAIPGEFEGVTKTDVTFTLENVKSFKNEANIEVTVGSLDDSSFSLDIYVDTSASWGLTLAIKGNTLMDGDSSNPIMADFKVEHSAPICNRRRFTDSGNAIEFGFDVPVNVTRTPNGGCEDFFRNIGKLGDGATCDMKTPQLLVVTIGKGTDLIEPVDVLTFKPDVIKPARQLFYKSLDSGGFEIAQPENPPTPSFTIAGPVTINRCGTYQLRAQQITGHGGRPVTYSWQLLTEVLGGSGLNSEFFNGLNQGGGSSVLAIDATDLEPGKVYEFALEVTNFLNRGSDERLHILSVNDDIKPVLEIKPVNVIPDRVRVSSRVKLEAVVTFSFGDGCQSSETTPTYEWSDPNDLIPVDLRDDRILVLPPNTLPANEVIVISVTVTSAQGSSDVAPTTVTETLTLTTIASPLVAEIIGASKLTLGPQDTVILDGSRSHDPDETGSLTYQWSCLSTASSESCDSILGNALTTSEVSVQASQFAAGTYTISLSVSSGSRTASASVTVIIAVDPVPKTKLKTRSERIKYRDDENVYIQANIVSSSAVTVAWSESNDRLNADLWERGETVQVPGSDKYITHVKIPPGQTTPGSQYTIELVTTDQNNKEAVAALDFSIYQPITQCEVQATPYIEMQEMTITATGCVTDPDSEPLTYQPVFALPLNDGYKKIILEGSRGESSQTVVATPIEYTNENVSVGFKVCDASLTCIDALTETKYVSTDVLSDTEREKFITDKIDKELEKGNVATAFSNAINIANMQKKSVNSEARRRKKRDVFSEFSFVYEGDLDSVLLVVDQIDFSEDGNVKSVFDEVANKQAEVLKKLGPSDSNEGAVILDLSSQMVQSTFTEGDIDDTLDAFDRIFEKADEEGFRHNSETIERALTTLGSSGRNLKDTSSSGKRAEQSKKISDLRKAGLKQVGQDFSIGDHVTLTISGTKMSIICFLPDNDTALDESAELPVTIRPGGSLADRYMYDWCTEGDEACSGVKALVIQIEDLETEITKCSEPTDITLINPVTDTDVPVSDLEDPIEIEMTMQVDDGQICVCKYWDENTYQLETTGVTSETTANGKVVCKSSHLTTFVGEVTSSGSTSGPATMQGGTKTPPSGQLGLILGLVFGVLGVILLVIIVGAVIFKVTQQKKVTPNGE